MKRLAIFTLLLLLLTSPLVHAAPVVPTNATLQALPFAQNWADAGLITASDDWSAVPGIVGYRGDDITTATGVDPQTLLADNTPGVIDVNANQTAPNTYTAGGVTEFAIADPVVALQGSGTADAPYLLIHLNTTGFSSIQVSYTVRDLDGSTDNAVQQVALHYRVGATGAYTNLPAGYIADATTGPSLATQVTAVNVTLPAAADNQAQVQLRIMTTNAVGNDEWVGIDDISITGTTSTVDTAPVVSSTTPTGGAINVAPGANLKVTFNEAVTVTGAWYGIACTVSGSHTAAVTGGPTTFDLDPTVDFAFGETCTVTVYAAQVADVDADDPPDAMAADATWSFSTPANVCDDPFVGIYAVQGSGASTPMAGSVDVEGVVVGDFQGATGLNGFYVQDPAGDGDPATSDGIFIFIPAANSFFGIDVQVGDAVHVKGTAKEFGGVTEIDNVTGLSRCGAGSVAPTVVDLPETTNGDLERYEGMLITFPETLTVSQNYFQGRYGQVTLSSDGRMYNPTNGNGLGDTFDLDARRILVLDDGYSGQNPAPIPYIGPDNTLRAGDTVAGLTGALDYGPINATSPYIYDYRVQPTAPVNITRVNARTAAPAAVGGSLKVASFNVLNYFTTWGCGDYCRGANNATEFARQRAKIIAALTAINADVVGLMEIENNGATAVGDLVAGLNDALGAGVYAYVTEPAPGSDAIKVALIYKPASVTPDGAAQNYQTSTATYAPLFDRPPLAQTFVAAGTGEKFTVVVNHFKSKGSCPASGPDTEQGDGQGCWNAKRVAQATGLLGFISLLQASSSDPDVLVLGDLNAYGAEDPINTLVAGGLVNQVAKIDAAQRYSYVFDGLSGYLDQGLTTAELAAQVTGQTIWHINADEPTVIDYNTEFKPQDLYAATPYRSSDHDPVIIGLGLFTYETVAGYVYIDVNGDGWRNAEEQSGLPDVTLVLVDAQGHEITTRTVPPSGWYRFSELGDGVYTLRVIVPAGYRLTSPAEVTLTVSGGATQIVNFGVQAQPVAAISGFIWDDASADGVQDAGEAGISGVTVALWDAVDGAPAAIRATTTTDATGHYQFGGLAAGSYFVDVTDTGGRLAGLTLTVGPQSHADPFGPVVVTWGETAAGIDFGYAFVCAAGRGAIAGRVWQDTDGNGQSDAAEPGVGGVTVCAEPASHLAARCTTTAADGSYRVCVPRGTYLVAPTTLPAGFARGQWWFELPLLVRPGDRHLDIHFDLVAQP